MWQLTARAWIRALNEHKWTVEQIWWTGKPTTLDFMASSCNDSIRTLHSLLSDFVSTQPLLCHQRLTLETVITA